MFIFISKSAQTEVFYDTQEIKVSAENFVLTFLNSTAVVFLVGLA